MPGFNVCGTGSDQPNSKAEMRRNHRWFFETIADEGIFSREVLLVLKSASRPKFTLEEAVMHHDQEQIYYAGKQSWEPIELTWYDKEGPGQEDSSAAILEWVKTVVDFSDATVAPPSAYKKDANLNMTDGAGNTSESWQLCNAWPKDVSWNGLTYDNSDIAEITVSMRFDKALRTA